MSTLYLDTETYNEADISVGTYKYAETAEVLLFAYAFEDGPVCVWDRTKDPFPLELGSWLNDDEVLLCAHNAMFDRAIITHALDIPTRLERWRCTMVQAYSHAFPGGLDQVGAALGLPKDQAKLKSGKSLINRFCKPAPKNHKADRYDSESHPEEWATFIEYAGRDIDAMREVDKRLPTFNWKPNDIALYHLDQTINDRGFLVDQELTEAGARAADDEKVRLAEEFVSLTGGVVDRPTQREKFRNYLNGRFGLDLENTRSETFRDMLQDDKLDIDPICRRLMELSILANKTSTAKYATLAPAVSSDGRFRGGLQFRGAARTRRWAGRTFQPQNLPSRGLPAQRAIDNYIAALKEDMHVELFEDQMLFGSAALRGVVVAPENKTLAVADLSNIEGRINAWLAGEKWKIQAFFDYDTFRLDDNGKRIPIPGKTNKYQRLGPDLYNVTATSILGGDPNEVSDKVRNVFGKVPDLAFGYEGGYGACQTFAKAYGVSFYDHWGTITENVDTELISSAKANYTKWGAERNPEADPDEWIASEVVKLSWRARHPKIKQLWKSCKEAAVAALENPGTTFRAGPWLKFKVVMRSKIRYLLCLLPSGNYLCYCQPRLHEDGTLTYMGIDSTATGGQFGKWQRLYTYGGKIVENACQSLAMDIMAANMPSIEQAGYEIILTVHDEIIAEAGNGLSGAGLAKLMAQQPEWLPDFPLAAAGFDTQRYRKD